MWKSRSQRLHIIRRGGTRNLGTASSSRCPKWSSSRVTGKLTHTAGFVTVAFIAFRDQPYLLLVPVAPRSSKSKSYLCLVESVAASHAYCMPGNATSSLQLALMIHSSSLTSNSVCKPPSAGMGVLSGVWSTTLYTMSSSLAGAMVSRPGSVSQTTKPLPKMQQLLSVPDPVPKSLQARLQQHLSPS